jgi:hypothetical protein
MEIPPSIEIVVYDLKIGPINNEHHYHLW